MKWQFSLDGQRTPCREHGHIFVTLDLKWFLSCLKFVLIRLSKSLKADGCPRRVRGGCDRCSQAGRERYLASYNLRRIDQYFRSLGFYILVSELHPLCMRSLKPAISWLYNSFIFNFEIIKVILHPEIIKLRHPIFFTIINN